MAIALRPITDDDVDRVSRFLEENMSSGVRAEAWRRSFDLHRDGGHPNNGFMLIDGEKIVGSYAAYYSTRMIDGRLERFCNLGAWCVLPDHRFHGVRLLRAVLKQDGYHFLDLSPSGSVVPLNERLGFTYLDDRLAILPALPWPVRRGAATSDGAVLERTLEGRQLAFYLDHRDAPAARHLVLRDGAAWCYVVFRMDRRKDLPRVFATVLHVSHPPVFHRMRRALGAHLLVHHRAVAVMVEERLTDGPPRGAVRMRSPRKKMLLSPTLRPEQVDYFYSELVSLPW